MGQTMELYIIRHGQSTNNALGNSAGRTQDPSLTAIGHQQAAAVAEHLGNGSCPDRLLDQREGYQIDRLYCSPMLRALQTARPIGEVLGLQPEVWTVIHEQGGIYLDDDDGGRTGYPGLTRQAILDQFPNVILPDAVTDTGWWNRDWESITESMGRAVAVASELTERGKHSDERIAIVSHGLFTNLLIKALFNQIPAPGIYYHHYNTAITRIDFHSNGPLVLRYLNRVNHLTPDLITH